jgi:hypothetical protein
MDARAIFAARGDIPTEIGFGIGTAAAAGTSPPDDAAADVTGGYG